MGRRHLLNDEEMRDAYLYLQGPAHDTSPSLLQESVEMDTCTRRFISLEQISLTNLNGFNELATIHQPSLSQREVICLEPRHTARAHYIVDSLNRLCCKPKSNLPTLRGDPSLDMFLSMDDLEDELDASSSQMGFLCASPPVRANNPLIQDVQFVRQTPTLASPFGNCNGGKSYSSKVERVPGCGTSVSWRETHCEN
ncbi:hypothetical protein HHK36_015975 [Tetracentron sinense]|uniref:Uncharacterized protein n=1 Tax=Tetracentron sinense TaxID=13715 RepID=A0A834Z407_TETSI|nr:hypothetical protein HHK36_015975 [Tetracentron sinense]